MHTQAAAAAPWLEHRIDRHIRRQRTVPLALVGLSALLFGGCTTPDSFAVSTSRFAEATATLAGASEDYLLDADHIDFETALVQAEFAGRPIAKGVLDRPFFPVEDMAARRALLAAMRTYAAALACIADQRLGDDFRSTAGQLRANLLTFERHLQEISPNSGLRALQSKSGFFAEVVGALGGLLLERAQAEAIVDAIIRADPAMRDAADLLEADLVLMSAKIREARALEFAIAVDAVNPLLPGAPLDRRTSLAGAVRPFKDRYLASRTLGGGFVEALAGYRAAQAEITSFAQGTRDPESLPRMIAAVDGFAVRARALVTLMRRGSQAIPSLTEEKSR
jgi:hypothetical protein